MKQGESKKSKQRKEIEREILKQGERKGIKERDRERYPETGGRKRTKV